jgi:hypothetical protein
MVTVIDYAARTNSQGENFFALILQGNLEMVKSRETGNYYATAKRASVTSTFTEGACEKLIGMEIPGSIQRVPSEPYEFTIPDTGEVIQLEHRWVYLAEGQTVDAVVQEEEVQKSSLV